MDRPYELYDLGEGRGAARREDYRFRAMAGGPAQGPHARYSLPSWRFTPPQTAVAGGPLFSSRGRRGGLGSVSAGCLLAAAGAVCLLTLLAAGVAVGWAMAARAPPPPSARRLGAARIGDEWRAAVQAAQRFSAQARDAGHSRQQAPLAAAQPHQGAASRREQWQGATRPTAAAPAPANLTAPETCLPALYQDGEYRTHPRLLVEGAQTSDAGGAPRLTAVPSYLRGKPFWRLEPHRRLTLLCPCGLAPRCAAYVVAAHCSPGTRGQWRPPLWASRRCAPQYHSSGRSFAMTIRRHTWDAYSTLNLHMEERLLREFDAHSASVRFLGVVVDTFPQCDAPQMRESRCRAERMCRWQGGECRDWACDPADDEAADTVPPCDGSGALEGDAAARIQALEREVAELRSGLGSGGGKAPHPPAPAPAKAPPRPGLSVAALRGADDDAAGQSGASPPPIELVFQRLIKGLLAGWDQRRLQDAPAHFRKSVAGRCDRWLPNRTKWKHSRLAVAHTASKAAGAFEETLRFSFAGGGDHILVGHVRYGDLKWPWRAEAGREGGGADFCAVVPETDDDASSPRSTGTLSGLADAATLFTRASHASVAELRALCDHPAGEEVRQLCATAWHVVVERAKAVLATRFAVVGVAERVEDVFAVARCRLPWLRGGRELPPIPETHPQEAPGASAALREAAGDLRSLHQAAGAILAADLRCCARLAHDGALDGKGRGDKNKGGAAADKNAEAQPAQPAGDAQVLADPQGGDDPRAADPVGDKNAGDKNA